MKTLGGWQPLLVAESGWINMHQEDVIDYA